MSVGRLPFPLGTAGGRARLFFVRVFWPLSRQLTDTCCIKEVFPFYPFAGLRLIKPNGWDFNVSDGKTSDEKVIRGGILSQRQGFGR